MACDSGITQFSKIIFFVSVKLTLYFSGIKRVSASSKPSSGCMQEDSKIKTLQHQYYLPLHSLMMAYKNQNLYV